MDKLEYDARAMLLSIRMGANKQTLDIIEKYQKSLNEKQKVEFNENYKYSQDDVSAYKYKLIKSQEELKRAMEAYMELPDESYRLTNFLFQLHNYKKIKTEKEKIEKVVKEKERVTEFFGGFSTTQKEKQGKEIVTRSKSSQELIDERNDRLAILNQMHAEGKITDEELKKQVISVRRVYGRAIENQTITEVQEETKKLENEQKITSKIKAKVKCIVAKVARAFKIKVETKVEEETTPDYKREFINRSAAQALAKCSDIITETEDLTREEVKNEVFAQSEEYVEILNQQNENIIPLNICMEMYKVQSLQAKSEQEKEYYRQKCLNFGEVLVPNENGEIQPNRDLEYQKKMFIDYMYKTYPKVQEWPENSPLPIERFEDPKIQELYNKVLEQFDANIEKAKEMLKIENVVKDMSSKTELAV